MSWMDSWSRPSKSQATPAPFYLLPGGENTPYCKSCGRVISSRKAHAVKETNTPAKYCSSRCRSHKPGRIDRRIEDAFVALLNGTEPLPNSTHSAEVVSHKKDKGQKKAKGDPRLIIPCDAVEEFVFGSRFDPEKTWGRKKNKPKRGAAEEEDWKSVDMISTDGSVTASDASATEDNVIDGDLLARMSVRSGTRIRPAQDVSEVNGSVGGEKGWAERVEETPEMLEKRREGEKRAEEKERVRSAARRGVAFGFVVQEARGDQKEERRKCEALMQGKVVEASFAKGDWSIRWRE